MRPATGSGWRNKMKLKRIRKVLEGRFLTRYDIEYETGDGREKVYEMVGRKPDMCTEEELQNRHSDSVILVMTDAAGERILLCREFRMAMDHWTYNFPGGLIDPGETAETGAARELAEETGLKLLRVDDVLEQSCNAIGLSNEKGTLVFGTAGAADGGSDEIFRSHPTYDEEIEPGWYTKEEVRKLLRTEPFDARTQAYCYLWAGALQ